MTYHCGGAECVMVRETRGQLVVLHQQSGSRARMKSWMLTCFLTSKKTNFYCLLYAYTVQDPNPENSAACNGCIFAPQWTLSRPTPTDIPSSLPGLDNYSLRLSFQVILGSVLLTKKKRNSHHRWEPQRSSPRVWQRVEAVQPAMLCNINNSFGAGIWAQGIMQSPPLFSQKGQTIHKL